MGPPEEVVLDDVARAADVAGQQSDKDEEDHDGKESVFDRDDRARVQFQAEHSNETVSKHNPNPLLKPFLGRCVCIGRWSIVSFDPGLKALRKPHFLPRPAEFWRRSGSSVSQAEVCGIQGM